VGQEARGPGIILVQEENTVIRVFRNFQGIPISLDRCVERGHPLQALSAENAGGVGDNEASALTLHTL